MVMMELEELSICSISHGNYVVNKINLITYVVLFVFPALIRIGTDHLTRID